MATERETVARRLNLTISIILGFVLTLTMTAYAANAKNEDSQQYIPQLKIENVIQMAKDYSIQKGMDLKEYYISTIKYDASTKEWDVFFEGNLPAPGFHFLIVIEDKTKAIRLSRGK